MTVAGDQIAVEVMVDVAPAVAFEVFTEEIDRWWKRGIAYRASGARAGGVLVLEPQVGGRLFEHFEDSAGLRVHEAGKVTAWDPPGHLAFEWRGTNFAPGEVTYVEVTFSLMDSGKTRVRLVHRGFAALRPDHPVRHGQPVVEFIGRLATWWGALMRGYREHAG